MRERGREEGGNMREGTEREETSRGRWGRTGREDGGGGVWEKRSTQGETR